MRGTWAPNKRKVEVTAPDCLVYINGELTMPSGASPYRRVDLQPLITSVNVSASVTSPPASADISLHIPDHLLSDFRIGRNLILTAMMEVRIYMKGYFLLNGAPQYYPVFWGVVTSVADSYASGQNTVSLSCQDMTYWWQVQHVNINPSILSIERGQAQRMSETGNVFTGMNAFQIMYTLSRQVHGDSVNVQQYLKEFQVVSEAVDTDNLRLTAYWAKRLGRITTALKMYGPNGRLIQGSLFADIIKPNTLDTVGDGKRGLAVINESVKNKPPQYDFLQGGVDLSQVTPFSLVLSKLGSPDVWNGELMSKIQIAQQVAEVVGYEFFQDVTGEIIFKPPFYNLDTYGNFPISWIRDIDLISDSLTENIPEATYIEGTGEFIQNFEASMAAETLPRATYIDYRLVQKYGWRKAEFNSQFVGSIFERGQKGGGPQALFLHLVDQLDRTNSRTTSGSVTIPLRPEMRLGYPVYHESRDTYYYNEGLSHSFTYGGGCTTSLTFMAGRKKFYADFEGYDAETGKEPAPSTYADPDRIVRNLYSRPIDPKTGEPRGDRNVVLVFDPDKQIREKQKTYQAKENQLQKPEELLKDDVVSYRSQFRPIAGGSYIYQIDPARDNVTGPTPYKKVKANQLSSITQITSWTRGKDKVIIFPVSDERGYEVFGSYEYGRAAQVTNNAFTFAEDETDKAAKALTFYTPSADSTSQVPNVGADIDPLLYNKVQDVSKSPTLQLSPNNYGARLTELATGTLEVDRFGAFTRGLGTKDAVPPTDPGSLPRGTYTANPSGLAIQRTPNGVEVRVGKRLFRQEPSVERWLPAIQRIRAEEGLSEADFPDDFMLAFIHVESQGNPSAGKNRKTKSGKPTQFNGLLQMGTASGKDTGIPELAQNSDALEGNGELAIRAFFKLQKRYRKTTSQYDPTQAVILWSRGISPLKSYRKGLQSGLSEEEALQTDAVSKHNVISYQNQIKAARSVWADKLGTEGYVPPEDTTAVSTGSGVSAASAAATALAATLAAQDIAASDLEEEDFVAKEDTIPEYADWEAEETNFRLLLFKNALQENLFNATDALPSRILPPRDPNVLPLLNTFLETLYQQMWDQSEARQAKLRGKNRLG